VLDFDIREALQLPRKRLPEDKPECARNFKLAVPELAWDDLLIHHSPFRAANNQEFQELTKMLAELEQLVIDKPSLRWYYEECMGVTSDEVPLPGEKASPVNFIVMQIQLMEDAYFSLRLDQYANARDNRGWMNLFRRWAKSPTFQKHFKQLQTIYSTDFVAFYCYYIHDWEEIDAQPLPHAWDVLHATDKDKHPVAFECRERGAPGLFLDPGRREVREPDEDDDLPVLDAPPHPTADQGGNPGLNPTDGTPNPGAS
jgi:hypothetical protein